MPLNTKILSIIGVLCSESLQNYALQIILVFVVVIELVSLVAFESVSLTTFARVLVIEFSITLESILLAFDVCGGGCCNFL